MTARKAHRAILLAWRRRPLISQIVAWNCALAAALLPDFAFAGQSARLVYSRTAEAAACGDESGLRQAVARRLGYDPFVASSINTVVAELRGDGEGLKARVYVIRDGNLAGGARELASATRNCTELIAAVALAMSIAIDPDSLDRVEPRDDAAPNRDTLPDNAEVVPLPSNSNPAPTKPPSDAQRAAVANKNTPPSSIKPPVTDTPPPSSGLEGLLGLNSFIASGFAPAPSLGVGLVGGLILNRHWVVALEPQVTAPSSRAPSGDPSIHVRVWSYGGTLALGYQAQGWYGGALFDAGQLLYKGVNVSLAKSDRSAYAAAGLRFAYRWRLSQSWVLEPRVDELYAFNRLKLKLGDLDAYDMPRLISRFGLALEYVF